VNADGHSTVRFWNLATLQETPLPPRRKSLVYDAGRWAPTFNWSRQADRLTLSATTATEPLEVWIVERPGPAPRETQVRSRAGRPARRQVTRSWSAGVPLDRLSKPELVRYPSFDGRQIPAFLFRPNNAPADAERPAILWVHGGPESQFRPSFNPVVQYLAHRGFVVLAPNVRGSTGHGKAYSHLDDVELRLDSVRDLAAAAEWLAASGEAHPKRIGVMGASYGGYMVLAAITERPDLWAAAVDIVGIANFVTFLERTGPWRRHLREAEYG
jgi:dipeptidyl aminopeptidase/acylaminoacyl peptidase